MVSPPTAVKSTVSSFRMVFKSNVRGLWGGEVVRKIVGTEVGNIFTTVGGRYYKQQSRKDILP